MGCLFHMKKCLCGGEYRYLVLPATNEERENQEIRLHIRVCAALAFLQPEHVEDGFIEIHSFLFDYFVDECLENEENP